MRLCVFLAVAALTIPTASAADTEKPQIIDQIIAKVNGAIITQVDLEQARRAALEDMKRRKIPESEIPGLLAKQQKNFLRDKIDQLLLIQKAKELDINVDKEVSKYFANLMLQFKVTDPDKFAKLVRQNTGMRFEDYKEEVKNSFLTQRVLGQEVGAHIVIPHEEVVKYYNAHKKDFIREERVFLREILVSTKGKKGAELAAAEKKAKKLVARARRGEKFDELARQYSDAVTASSGGDLGGWKKGDLRKDIESRIWNKERGYVTDPIKTANGYLILKVMAHHKAGLAMLDEVENEIKAKLYEPRFQPKVRAYLTKLREQAYLQIKDGYVDTAAAPGKDTHWMKPAQVTPETVTREEVLRKPRRKRLFWLIPIPGTKANPKSSSR